MLKQFSLTPHILEFDTCDSFCEYFAIGSGDLVFISKRCYETYFKGSVTDATIVFRDDYGIGEPTDAMVEAIYEDIKNISYKRVYAIGGGTIIDVAKLLALKTYTPVADLFYHKTITPEQTKELIIVPTTCGTGSEVTNISILELKSLHTKLGLAHDRLFPQYAVLIPELLNDLPLSVFATSSIDSLVHATESYLSPKSTPFSQLFSLEAIKMILSGYKQIVANGLETRNQHSKEFLIASTYAGIAFGNAGTGAVHAMSYPLGANYHVAHGEANYAIFTGVFKVYQQKHPTGAIAELNKVMAEMIGCKPATIYDELENLLNQLLPKKPLRSYGVSKKDLNAFTENVITKQGRLTANNYVPLSKDEIHQIYVTLF